MCCFLRFLSQTKKNVKSVDERERKKRERKKQTKRLEKRDKNSLSFSLPIGGVGGVVCIPRNAAALVFFPPAKRRRRSNSNTLSLSLSSERKKRREERAFRATEEERIRNVFQGIRFSSYSNWHRVRELEQKRPRVV